jgi:hypothetical protein
MMKNLPQPLFYKEGRSSLWKRESRRDFRKFECLYYYETVNRSIGKTDFIILPDREAI